MDMQHILTLIQAVSDSSLSGFALEEGDFRLSLSRGGQPLTGAIGATGQLVPGSQDYSTGQHLSSQVSSGRPDRLAGQQAVANGQSAPGMVDLAGTEAETASGTCVKSPLVGTFYASAGPEEAPFVSVGDMVKKGQVLGIVEAMKLMNEIESEADGVVKAIYVENEQMVEYGQSLFLIG